MSPRNDVDYFRDRALQEQVAAGNSQSPAARKCHDELAMIYRFKAAMLSSGPDSWGAEPRREAGAGDGLTAGCHMTAAFARRRAF